MRRIEIHPPRVEGRRVTISWTLDPPDDLYRRTSFHLDFPSGVALERVPDALWWRIALMCLHSQWAVLRPCRVELPISLPPGEAETWLRLCDAGVASLETACDPPDTRRTISLDARGPLSRLDPIEVTTRGGAVSCFSGGRDGTTQAALLMELGVETTLLTVTSPMTWPIDQSTTRRREVLAEMPRRTGLDLVEVRSDLREQWRPTALSDRYGVGINELGDALLYTAAATAVAAARGVPRVLIAAETEVHDNDRRGGMVVQRKVFMYSAPTHAALSAVLAPTGITVGSLTYPLRQFQVQRLLSTRYPSLLDLQYSCWSMTTDCPACSRCMACRRIALNLLVDGVSPHTASIDLTEVLLACADWQPAPPPVPPPGGPIPLVLAHDELRALATVSPERVEGFLSRPGADDSAGGETRRTEALGIYHRLHRRALELEPAPEPGYREGYLELVDPDLRDGLGRILSEHFIPEPLDAYRDQLVNIRVLSRWLSSPLRAARQPPP